jgi:hypothetical protein
VSLRASLLAGSVSLASIGVGTLDRSACNECNTDYAIPGANVTVLLELIPLILVGE